LVRLCPAFAGGAADAARLLARFRTVPGFSACVAAAGAAVVSTGAVIFVFGVVAEFMIIHLFWAKPGFISVMT
jgi:hypothetical protein